MVDDSEPITGVWLVTNGFTEYLDADKPKHLSWTYWERNGLALSYWHDHWRWQIGGLENWWEYFAIPTRGTVRSILSFLGVKQDVQC